MTIFDLLKKDHEEAMQLFDKLEELKEKSDKQSESKKEKLFSQLKHELEVHASSEEAVFYMPLKKEDATHTMILEAIEEHNVMRTMLKEMNSPSKDEKWFAKLSVLRENVEHHVDEEEGELFDEAKDILDDSQIKDMAKQMEEMKKSQMAGASK